MTKKEIWQTIIKILIYALSAFGGAFTATSCTFNSTVNNESNAQASAIVPRETCANDTVIVWE